MLQSQNQRNHNSQSDQRKNITRSLRAGKRVIKTWLVLVLKLIGRESGTRVFEPITVRSKEKNHSKPYLLSAFKWKLLQTYLDLWMITNGELFPGWPQLKKLQQKRPKQIRLRHVRNQASQILIGCSDQRTRLVGIVRREVYQTNC